MTAAVSKKPLPILRATYNPQSVKKNLFMLALKEVPCQLLTLSAGFLAVSSHFVHNPRLELGIAIGASFAGEYVGDKIWHARKGAPQRSAVQNAKRYGLSLVFGLAVWYGHQEIFHHKHAEPHHAVVTNAAATSVQANIDTVKLTKAPFNEKKSQI